MQKRICVLLYLITLFLFNCSNNKKEQKSFEIPKTDSLKIPKIDSLVFDNQLRAFSDYNVKFKTEKVTGSYQLCTEKIPDKIISQINSSFFNRSGKSVKDENWFKIIRVDFLCTSNGWKIYDVKYGDKIKEGVVNNIIGCFYKDKHYILTDVFFDVCSRKSLNKIEESNDTLQVILCEYFNCTCDDESFYSNSFQISKDGLTKARSLLKEPCNSMKCDFVIGIVE